MLNEKFFELYKKAHITLARGTSFEPQLFGKLIVRECLNVINHPNGVGDADVIRISRDIKKHFGVEE